MTRKIFKYLIDPRIPIEIRVNAKILSVQMQHKEFTLWALVDDDETHKEEYRFSVFGTGWDIPDDYVGEYLATLQDYAGFVWHIFRDAA